MLDDLTVFDRLGDNLAAILGFHFCIEDPLWINRHQRSLVAKPWAASCFHFYTGMHSLLLQCLLECSTDFSGGQSQANRPPTDRDAWTGGVSSGQDLLAPYLNL